MRNRSFTSLPILATTGLVCPEEMTWHDIQVGWSLAEHHVFQHRLGRKGVDIDSLSSADLAKVIRETEAEMREIDNTSKSI